MIIRVHGDTFTEDIKAAKKGAYALASNLLVEGVWCGNTLYPPHRIVKIELLED